MPDVDEDDLEAELDALGDEIALDDDTSYLDDAISAPSVPSRSEMLPFEFDLSQSIFEHLLQFPHCCYTG